MQIFGYMEDCITALYIKQKSKMLAIINKLLYSFGRDFLKTKNNLWNVVP